MKKKFKYADEKTGREIEFSFSPEQLKQLNELGKRLAAGIEELKKDISKLKDTFEIEYAAIKPYMEGQKEALPNGAEEFVKWFLYVKHEDKTPREIRENWPIIEAHDFKLFSDFKKRLYKQGGRIGDFSNVPVRLPDNFDLYGKDEKSKPVLPPLSEVVKDADTFLPKLWEALAGMEKPLVSRSGKYIWDGENVSVLMALAQALKTADRIESKYTTEEIYRMLCRHFPAKEADRPRINAKTASRFTNAYTDQLADFNDVLRDL